MFLATRRKYAATMSRAWSVDAPASARTLPAALEDHEVVVERVLGERENVAPVLIHSAHLEVLLHEGAVLLGAAHVGAALELHELTVQEGRIRITQEDIDHHEGAPVGEEAPHAAELAGEDVVGDVMEAAVGHDEVEGRSDAQLLLHGDETRAAIEPPSVAHEPRVDIVAHVAQARRLESGRKEPRAAAEVEGKGALGQREGAQALPKVTALLPGLATR